MHYPEGLSEWVAAQIWNKTQMSQWDLPASLTPTTPASRNYLSRNWFFTEMYDCYPEIGWDPRWVKALTRLAESLRRPVWKPSFVEDRDLWQTCYQLLAGHATAIEDTRVHGVSMGSPHHEPTELGFLLGKIFLGVHHTSDKNHIDILDNAVSALNNFCVYGVVNCLTVSAAITITEPELVAAYWGEYTTPTPLHLLDTALRMLEDQGAFDMMESSLWPLRSLDLRLMRSNYLFYERQGLPHPREIVLYQRDAADQCLPGQPHPALCSNASLTHWLFSDAWRPLPKAAQVVFSLRSPPKGDLIVAVFGLHGSLKMEPMTALRAACPEVRFQFRLLGTDCRPRETARLYACKLLCSLQNRCHLLPGGDDSPIAGGIFEDQLGNALSTVLEMSRRDLVAFQGAVNVFHEVVAAAEELKGLDLFICVDGIYCPLFRPQLRGVPFLLYMSHPLLNSLGDQDVLRTQLSAFRSELLEGRAIAAVAFTHLSAWSYYAAGVRLPLIRSEALYLDHVQYRPRSNKDILFLRTSFWGTFTGAHFKSILDRLLWNNNLASAVDCTFIGAREFMEYEEMATFHAAVLVPLVNYVMSFDEFYSIGMPLLLPNREWLTKLFLHSAYTTFAKIVFNPDVRVSMPGNVSSDLPFPVHVKGSSLEHDPDDFHVLYFWHSLSPFGIYPYVLAFDSVPDLLHQLMCLDVVSAHALHAGMKSYVTRSRIQTLAWYRKAFQTLLGPSPS